jgi:hypothetical protein
VKTTAECLDFTVEGLDFEIATLDNDATAYSNRNHAWKNVPERFRGWRFTRVGGNHGLYVIHIGETQTISPLLNS